MERPPRPMATMPDWTSSLIPNGSSTLISASSFSRLPVASTVTTSSATSTTRARNSLTVSSTRDRLSASARTLIRISSRCTVAPGSSSTIFSTLMSLFSCLVTCSSGCSSQLTTIVIREISSCSVGPTARESMLKPRRANSPAILTRTPGLFSTSTDKVCRVMLPLLFWRPYASARRARSFGSSSPVGRQAARELDVVVAGAGRDHGPDHGVPVHDEVHHDRAVVDGHGPLDDLVHVGGLLAADALAVVGLGELDEVGDAGAGQLPLRRPVQVGVRVALVVEQRLPLPDHAKAAVVDDRHLDRDALDGAGGQLLVGHLEAAVAVDRPHGRVRAAGLGAHGGRHGEAHRAEPARVDPGAQVLVVDEVGRPHVVLADAGHVHRLRARDLADPLDHVLRRERAVVRLVVTQGIGG